MNSLQKEIFAKLIGDLSTTFDFYHGDCIGADADAHKIVVGCQQEKQQELSIKKRPCNMNSYRAFTEEGECIAEPENPLDRNKKLVDDGEVLIAVPGGEFEETRSGTWSTIRYAKRNKKPVIIIWPNGHIS